MYYWNKQSINQSLMAMAWRCFCFHVDVVSMVLENETLRQKCKRLFDNGATTLYDKDATKLSKKCNLLFDKDAMKLSKKYATTISLLYQD